MKNSCAYPAGEELFEEAGFVVLLEEDGFVVYQGRDWLYQPPRLSPYWQVYSPQGLLKISYDRAATPAEAVAIVRAECIAKELLAEQHVKVYGHLNDPLADLR